MLLPVRNEADRVTPTLRSLLDQRGLADAEIIVYDDGSTDGTANVVRDTGGPTVQLLIGGELPPGGSASRTPVRSWPRLPPDGLVFVDADVVLAEDAVAATVTLLRTRGLQFVSPYPRQIAGSWLERLVQPLLWWSWLTFLPLRDRRTFEPAVACGGQRAAARRRCAGLRDAGGHAAVRDRGGGGRRTRARPGRSGAHGGFVDGSASRTAGCTTERGLLSTATRSRCGARSAHLPAPSRWRCCFSSRRAAVGARGVTAWAWPAAVGGAVEPAGHRVADRQPADGGCAGPSAVGARVRAIVVVSIRRHRAAAHLEVEGAAMSRVVVIGGGIGGLAVAARLARHAPRRDRWSSAATPSAASSASGDATASGSTPGRRW